MIHPSTEVRHTGGMKGYGLFATAPMPKGTITWIRDDLDREISPEELQRFSENMQEVIIHFSYRNCRGNYMFCWDNTRYMNHDNSPNTCITPYELEIAIRDIDRGEEITNHYGMLNIIEPFTLFDGVTTVYPDDLLRRSEEWDSLLRDAFPLIGVVNQPLLPFIARGKWTELTAVGSGSKPMQSVSSCYFAG